MQSADLDPALHQLLESRRAERMRMAELAAFAAGQLDKDAQERVAVHLETCPRCRADLRDLDDLGGIASPDFANDNAPAPRADQPREQSRGAKIIPFRRRWWPVMGLIGAVAAGLLAWALAPSDAQRLADSAGGGLDPSAATSPMLAKGAWSMHVGVRRGDVSFRASPGERLHPGDQLGLFYSSARSGHLMVFYIDDQGETVRVVPAREAESLSVSPGSERPLPDSAVVGPGGGCEYIVGVFASTRFQSEPARRAAGEAVRAMQTRGACLSGALRAGGLDAIIHAVPRTP